jgi:S1-C subfamily serine protease
MLLDTLPASGQIGAELSELTNRLRQSVVEIQSGRGSGSGIIWSRDGIVVTNHHVAAEDVARVSLADGQRFEAPVVQRDVAHDLAALRLPQSDLPAVTVGDSSALRVGQLVIAIGNPHGVPRAVSVGIISGPRDGQHGRLAWRNGIQAEILLRPGNSGGPLLIAAGEVIAVNSMVIGPRLALSVPSATVEAMLASTRRPQLGVQVQLAALPANGPSLGLDQPTGVLITNVIADSAADRAGLWPGDLLVRIRYQQDDATRTARLVEPGDLSLALGRALTTAPVGVTFLRGGRQHELDITFAHG